MHLFRELIIPSIDGASPNRERIQLNRRPTPNPPDRPPSNRQRVEVTPDRGPMRIEMASPFRESASTRPELFSTRRHSQFFYVEPKADEITPAQKKWLTGFLNQFEDVLYGPNFKDPTIGYSAYIDADSFIDHHLLVEVTKNIDGFRFSTFFHKDRGGKLKIGPLWDWNLSIGNSQGKQGWMPEYWYWPQLDDQQYSWYRRLFEDPDFGQRYADRWGQLRTNIFAAARLGRRIDELVTLLNEAQARNFQKWPILGRQVWPNYFIGRSYSDEVRWMKQWISTRIAWIDNQFVSPPTFSLSAGAVSRGSSLAMQASVGKIFYTLDGSDPRAPGGGVASRAKLYTAELTLNEHANIFDPVFFDERWS